jgi:hypothetical protein
MTDPCFSDSGKDFLRMKELLRIIENDSVSPMLLAWAV